MLFESKTIALKDGRTAVLRSPRPEEAAEMLEYLKTVSGETHFVLREVEECTMSLERETAFLEAVGQAPGEMMILCEVDGCIAGNCHLSFMQRAKVRHRGSIAIALVRQYWGLGIGTAMFEAMICTARENGIAQLELEVIEGNERAIALYEKMGFVRYGERPDAIRLKDGTSLKEYMMLLKL